MRSAKHYNQFEGSAVWNENIEDINEKIQRKQKRSFISVNYWIVD